jgi:[ribosomal protein S5]-alanine N-acetyltransferase
MSELSQTTHPSLTFPELMTDRLLLREFRPEDVQAVYDILRREDVNEWLETEPLRSIEEAEKRLASRINLFRDRMGYRWAVTLQEDPARVVGSCGYFSVRRGTQTVETGYELHPDHWKKGLMTEALQAMIRFSFSAGNPIPAHRIEALVLPDNLASIRTLEKLGFEREGVRREFGFWKGRYQDVLLYALLDQERSVL